MTEAQIQTGGGMSQEELNARIAKLRSGTEVKLTDMNVRARADINRMQERVSTSDAKTSQRRQAARDRVQSIDLDEVGKYVDQERIDMRDVIASLFEVTGTIDASFKMTSEKNPADDAIIANSKQAVVDAQAALDSANAMWNWLNIFWNMKTNAVLKATTALTSAKNGVGMAEVQVQNNIMERLRNGGFQQLFQQLTLITQRSIESLKLKIQSNALRTKSVTTVKEASSAEKVELTETMGALDAELERLKGAITTKSAERDAIDPKLPAYAQAHADVQKLENEYRQAEEDHNTALVKIQRLSKFIEDLGVQETALMNIHQSLTLSKATLETDLPRRIESYEASLEAKQGHSDLLIAEKVTDVGSETDIRLAEESAAIAAAAGRMVLKQVQKAPAQIKEMQDLHASLIKALIPIMEGMSEEAKKVYTNNGLDPNATSFVTYLNQGGAPGAVAA